MTAAESSKIDMIHDEVKKIGLILTGNGDPKKGMIVRLDRVEQHAKRATWIFATVVTAVISAAALWLFKVL